MKKGQEKNSKNSAEIAFGKSVKSAVDGGISKTNSDDTIKKAVMLKKNNTTNEEYLRVIYKI